LFIGQSYNEKRKRKKRDDCKMMMMMVIQLRERKEGQRKERWGDRCQVNDLEHILSERKTSSLMIGCLKCVTASAFIIGQHIHIHGFYLFY
jgi:hypothetical protein